MAEGKTITIKPLVDIVYGGENHKKDSEPFNVPADLGKRLIDGKKAVESK